MAMLKLAPGFKDYLWGGYHLVDEYHKKFSGEVLAESWELSCCQDCPSTIANGKYTGRTLEEYIQKEGKDVLGTHCRRFKDFPILVKLIDAKENLSIQVHPNHEFALKNEGQYGKSEMWYVMEASEGACLYYGFKREISKEEFAQRIKNETLLEVIDTVPVQKGDVFFIDAGTIHAIGKGIVVAEIQQNSSLTYRVYDFGRVDKNGKKRDLHIEKALAVTNCVPTVKSKPSNPHIASCDDFIVDRLNLDGAIMKKMNGFIGPESFVSLLIMDGKGSIRCGDDILDYQKGDSFFLTANSGEYEMTGHCEALVTTIGKKTNPVRIGIDIGGTDTKIGLVDANQKLIASTKIPTNASRFWKEVIESIGKASMQLLVDENIPFDRCIGVGVGVPGIVDKKQGTVIYSNNICWENIPLAKELQKDLPLPIYLANDADCAALGEVADGAGKDYEDVIMLTLGTGVGGGIILDRHIYEGKFVGGSELGHCVIVEDGEQCTCGRKGCLEAYVSATALLRDGKRMMETSNETMLWKRCVFKIENLNPEMIFDASAEGDVIAKKLIWNYQKKLTTGIANLVNIFRPQVVLIGGGISKQGEKLIQPVRDSLKEQSFGGREDNLPEVRIAKLGNKAGIIGAANLVG